MGIDCSFLASGTVRAEDCVCGDDGDGDSFDGIQAVLMVVRERPSV